MIGRKILIQDHQAAAGRPRRHAERRNLAQSALMRLARRESLRATVLRWMTPLVTAR
jgi:hypothetical protein